MYDGGSEISLLEAVPEHERSDAQKDVLSTADKESWCRPCFPLRDQSGSVLDAQCDAGSKRESVYAKTISHFAVGQCPAYRRHGALKREQATPDGQSRRHAAGASGDAGEATGATPTEDDAASRWESSFAQDVRGLAAEIFVHICGESCHKYSGKKVQQICRHGFYYIVNLGDWERRSDGISFRRRGKALRNSIFVVKQTKHGMQGRLLQFQEQPYEVQTNYSGAASLRCNFDVQDLRRVLPDHLWKPDDATYPSLPVDESRAKEMGYMGVYEWDGEAFAPRESGCSVGAHRGPEQWQDEKTRPEWREAFLAAMNKMRTDDDTTHDRDCACLKCECLKASVAAFADAVNTGFYVNSYTTKQCPTMEGSSKI